MVESSLYLNSLVSRESRCLCLCVLGRPRRGMRAPQRHHLVELRIGRGLEGALEPGRILDAEREARARTRLEQPAARRDFHLVTQMEVGPAGGTAAGGTVP